MPNIIDRLLVVIGLDPKPYQEGAKQAEAQQKKLTETVQKGSRAIDKSLQDSQSQQKKHKEALHKDSDEIIQSLKGIGLAAGGLVLGFETARAAVDAFTDLGTQTASVGRFSQNIGLSAHEVNTWGKAVELAGGQANDAGNDLQNLSSSITALKSLNTVTPLLLLISRMNVQLYDAQGNVRKLTDIYKDLGDALDKYNRADAFNLLQQAGLSQSTINLLLQQKDARDKLLQQAEAANKLDEKAVANAQKIQEAWRGTKQAVEGLEVVLSDKLDPAITWILNKLTKFLTLIGNKGILGAWVESIASTFGLHPPSDEPAIAAPPPPAASASPPVITPSGNTNSGVRGIRNNNPGNLRYAGQAGATSDKDGFAVFPTMAAGIKANNAQVDIDFRRGQNTIRKLIAGISNGGKLEHGWAPASENDTEAYIKELSSKLNMSPDAALSAKDRQKLLAAIFAHESGAGAVSPGTISSSLGYADFANAQTSGSTPQAIHRTVHNNTQIDSVTINTQATDAQGIATELPGAFKRKGIVAQADTGLF